MLTWVIINDNSCHFYSLKIIAQVWISRVVFAVILIVTLKLTNNWSKVENTYRYYFGSYQRFSDYVITVFFAQGNVEPLL